VQFNWKTASAWTLAACVLAPSVASAELLAILNYETKAEESLEALALQSAPDQRREGIAIMELDPA